MSAYCPMCTLHFHYVHLKKWYESLYSFIKKTLCSQVYNSKRFRAGKGKMRNRRRIQRRGPLIIYNQDNGLSRAFRNIPGIILRLIFQKFE